MTRIEVTTICIFALALLFSTAHADAQTPVAGFEVPKAMKKRT